MADFNATLRTIQRNGVPLLTPMRVSSLSRDLSLDLRQGQRKVGLIFYPIRIQEQFLTFEALYPSVDSLRFEADMSAIRQHWAWVLSGNPGEVMELSYKGDAQRVGATVYKGWIEGYQRTYAWNDVLWRRQFRMRLVTTLEGGARLTERANAPYIPHRGDVENWGTSWYTAKKLKRMSKYLAAGAKGNMYPDPSPTSPQGQPRVGRKA